MEGFSRSFAHAHCICRRLSSTRVRHCDLHHQPVHRLGGRVRARTSVCHSLDDPQARYDCPEQVRLELEQEELASYGRGADFLNFNGNDLVCLQHEYGIYGGSAGSHILTLLRKLKMPLVTTLHTVLREPDAQQRTVCSKRSRGSPIGWW